jgi:hypothetical protein
MFEPRRARCRPIGLRPESCWNDDKEEIDRTVVGSVTWTTSPDAKAGRRPRARGADRERTFFPTTHIQYNSQPSVAADPAMALSFIGPAASAIQRHARRPLLSTTACASP